MTSTALITRDITCSSALGKCGIPGMDWSLNPYTGCGHACVYCYATFMKRFTRRREPWGSFVDVKTNVAAVLERQVRRKRSGRVMMSSVTDAWQPIEKERRLTRACLEVLAGSGLSLSALTKSNLVVRDLDVLRSFGGLFGDSAATVGLTLTTTSDEIGALVEPGASLPSRRLEALEKLSSAGIETWVFMSPILPGLTDSEEEMEAVATQAIRRGARDVAADPLNFYPSAVRELERVVARRRPSSIPALRRALAEPEAWRRKIRERAASFLRS